MATEPGAAGGLRLGGPQESIAISKGWTHSVSGETIAMGAGYILVPLQHAQLGAARLAGLQMTEPSTSESAPFKKYSAGFGVVKCGRRWASKSNQE